jgi:ribosomal protein L29
MKQAKVDLSRLKNKIQLKRVIILLNIVIAAAALIVGVLLIYSRFEYVGGLFGLLINIPIACFAVGAVVSLFLRPSDLSAAVAADSLGYNERFVTAVELADKTELTEMESLALEDARRISVEVRLDKEYSLKLPKSILLITLASVVFLIICLLVPIKKTEKVQNLEDMHQKYDTAIEDIVNDVDADKLDEEKKQQINTKLSELKKELSKTNDKAKAEEQLMKTQTELKKISDEGENEKLKQLGDKLSDNKTTQAMGEALKNSDISEFNRQIEALNNSLDNLSEAEMKEIGKDLKSVADSMENELDEQTKEILTELSDNMQAEASAGQRESISKELDELSNRIDELASDNQEVRETVSKINRELARLSNDSPLTANNGDISNSEAKTIASGETGGNTTGEEGSDRGSGAIANEDIYTAKAKNYGDYNAELEDKAEKGSGEEQKTYVDGEKGSVVPYGEVLGEYKNEAINATEKDSIPYGVRNIVKDYFSSLE